MKLQDYVTNKEVSISNDDFDLEKLENDLRKGYVKESEVESRVSKATEGMVKKSDFDDLQNKYTTLESNYNSQTERLNDTNNKMKEVTFNSKLTRKGFQDKDFKEVTTLRESVFKDIKDDDEAINKISERYRDTYFPKRETTPYTQAPNDAPVISSTNKGNDIKITRNTSINDLVFKKN